MKRANLAMAIAATELFACAMLVPIEAFGQSDDSLVVTASRAGIEPERVGQSVTVITHSQIEESQQPGVTELLTRTPGVQFSRNGGRGTVTSVYIRGADNAQTLVLYDGVRLHDPSAIEGAASLADVTTGGIDRIEVLRGTQSVLYGSQAIGGVINITSREPTEALEASLQAEAGELDSSMFRGAVGGAHGALTWRAGAGYSATDGISSYAPGSEADGYENVTLNARLGYAVSPGLSLDLRSYHARGDAEFDAFDGDAANRSLTKSWLTFAGVDFALSERLESRLSYGRTAISRTNLDESDPAAAVRTFDAHGHSERFEYQGTFSISVGSFAVFGAEYAENAFYGSSAPGTAGNNTLGLYANLSVEPTKGLTLTGGLRREDHSSFGVSTVFAASAAYSPNGGDSVLRASYSEGFKAPGLFQLFDGVFGNPDLQPETAVSWEAGAEHGFANGFSLSAVYFHRKTDNLVAFVPCSAEPARDPCLFGFYANNGRVAVQGVEMGADLDLGAVMLSGNYAWLDAAYDTPGSSTFGNRLALRARHKFNAEASYTAGFGLTLSASASVVGGSFNDAANSQRLSGYVLVDLRVSYPLNERAEIYARMENLFDERYQTILDYGSLPRLVSAGVRWRL